MIQLPRIRLGGALDNGFSDGLANVQESVVPNDDVGCPRSPGLHRQDGRGGHRAAVRLGPPLLGRSGGRGDQRRTTSSKWGYIDKTGAWVIQPQFDTACPFPEGLAAVGNTELRRQARFTLRWSFIDKTGKVVIALQQSQGPVGVVLGGCRRGCGTRLQTTTARPNTSTPPGR